jgi:hypothetical protein
MLPLLVHVDDTGSCNSESAANSAFSWRHITCLHTHRRMLQRSAGCFPGSGTQ